MQRNPEMWKKHVDGMLREWGAWARDNPARRLGYPTMSVEQRAKLANRGGTRGDDNPMAEDVEAELRVLSERHQDLARYAYMQRLDLRSIGDRMNMSYAKTREELGTLVSILAGRLAERYQIDLAS